MCVSFLHVFVVDHVNAELAHAQHIKSMEVATMHACCEASVMDHLELWKTISSSTVQDILVLLALGAAFILSVSFIKTDLYKVILLKIYRQQYGCSHFVPSPFDTYKYALSQGIINPKLF